jgi:hypothetical protein
MNGIVEVKADGIRRLSVDDKPTKIQFIQFFIGDDIVAEFYPEHICGWVELKERMRNETKS